LLITRKYEFDLWHKMINIMRKLEIWLQKIINTGKKHLLCHLIETNQSSLKTANNF
jgi:dsDNA-binding SOS-regulon protein